MPRNANSGAPRSSSTGSFHSIRLVGNDIPVQVKPDAQRLGQPVGGVERAGIVATGEQEHSCVRGGRHAGWGWS